MQKYQNDLALHVRQTLHEWVKNFLSITLEIGLYLGVKEDPVPLPASLTLVKASDKVSVSSLLVITYATGTPCPYSFWHTRAKKAYPYEAPVTCVYKYC